MTPAARSEGGAVPTLGLGEGVGGAGGDGVGAPQGQPQGAPSPSGPLVETGGVHGELAMEGHHQRQAQDPGCFDRVPAGWADALDVDQLVASGPDRGHQVGQGEWTEAQCGGQAARRQLWAAEHRAAYVQPLDGRAGRQRLGPAHGEDGGLETGPRLGRGQPADHFLDPTAVGVERAGEHGDAGRGIACPRGVHRSGLYRSASPGDRDRPALAGVGRDRPPGSRRPFSRR